MKSKPRNIAQVSDSWDTYWQGSNEAAAYTSGGVQHPVIKQFWDKFLQQGCGDGKTSRCLDIASGNGAVVEALQAALTTANCEITSVDISPGAIAAIKQRFPGVTGIVADAANIPLDSATFDMVTSQFGVEYAGADAIAESARLLAPGGRLALVMHHAGGSIYSECSASLDAIRRTQESQFVPLSLRLFETGFAACRGADRAPYDAAGRALNPAIAVIEDVMREHGENVAGNTISRLYGDVARIHHAIQRYDPAEVMSWLTKMGTELDAFSGRMSSMCASALDEEAFRSATKIVTDGGLSLQVAQALDDSPHNNPLAWVIVAHRQ